MADDATLFLHEREQKRIALDAALRLNEQKPSPGDVGAVIQDARALLSFIHS